MTGKIRNKQNWDKDHYYTCSKKKRFRDCDKKNVRQEVIEAAVLNATIELLQDSELM